jgi:hypothetical protein
VQSGARESKSEDSMGAEQTNQLLNEALAKEKNFKIEEKN